MPPELTVKEAHDLHLANRIIHDCWFDIGDISFDRTTATLIIPFHYEAWDQKKPVRRILFIGMYTVPIVKYFLRFHNVIRYQILPSEETEDWGIFDKLVLRDDRRTVEIRSCVGPDMEVQAEALEIEVLSTGEVLRRKSRLSLF